MTTLPVPGADADAATLGTAEAPLEDGEGAVVEPGAQPPTVSVATNATTTRTRLADMFR